MPMWTVRMIPLGGMSHCCALALPPMHASEHDNKLLQPENCRIMILPLNANLYQQSDNGRTNGSAMQLSIA